MYRTSFSMTTKFRELFPQFFSKIIIAYRKPSIINKILNFNAAHI